MTRDATATARRFGDATGRAWRTIVLAGVLSLTAAYAWTLDFTDIKNLLANGVPEPVIINMVNQQGGSSLTVAEANELRRAGASENLIATLGLENTFVRPDDASPLLSTPTIVQGAPPAPCSSPPCSGSAPTVVQDTPPTPAPTPALLAASPATSFPLLGEKEGWLSVTNRDMQPYFLLVNTRDKRMFISRNPNGGVTLNPGQTVKLGVRRETYKLYGDTGAKLEVKIREKLTTTLSLDPFGVAGNSGLTGVATDRGKTRSEVLFAPYVPPPQVVIAPSPIIVRQPPVVVAPPPPRRHYYGRPGFYFHYSR